VDRVPSLLPPLPTPVRALALGFVAGIRSQIPVALLAVEARQGRFDPGAGRLARRFSSRQGMNGALVAFAGELVADKLPMTPRRTTWGPFTQRLATGGTIGAAVHYDAGEPRPLGALLGAAGAGAGAYAATKVRAFVAERTHLPGPLLGAAEDLVAVALAVAVVTAGRDAGR
jgi:uncharacterized membrane protein